MGACPPAMARTHDGEVRQGSCVFWASPHSSVLSELSLAMGSSGRGEGDAGCCPSLRDSDPPGSGSPWLSPGWAQLPPFLSSPLPCAADWQKGPPSCAALHGLLCAGGLLVEAARMWRGWSISVTRKG